MRASVAGILLASLLLAPHADALDVTACGVVAAPGEVATLEADVDCTQGSAEFPDWGITLGRGATLDLNGHTLTLEPSAGIGAVQCTSRCEVAGPGAITGAGSGVAIHIAFRV